MIEKKNPEKETNAYRSVFVMVGLVATLLVTIIMFEWTFGQGEVDDMQAMGTEEDDMEEVIITEILPPPPPKIQVPIIEIVEDEEEIEEDDEPLFEEPEEEMVIEAPPEEVVEEEEVEEIFMVVEEEAQPKGGMGAFRAHIAKYLGANYPERAKKLGITGTVYINFYIDKDGTPKGFNVLKGIDPQCDKAAIDAIKAYGTWTPAKQRGKQVKQGFNIPVKFKIG